MTAVKRTPVPADIREEVALGPKCSEAQAKYIRDLVERRQLPDDVRDFILKNLDGEKYSVSDASMVIDKLRVLPRVNSQYVRNLDEMPSVESGRYAITHPDVTEGVLKFYRVKIGKKDTRWAGFVFLDAGRGGAHGDLQWTPIKDVAYKKAVLEQIAKDPRESALRFGREIGACWRCGRSLTDETSRAFGMGPDCRAEAGW